LESRYERLIGMTTAQKRYYTDFKLSKAELAPHEKRLILNHFINRYPNSTTGRRLRSNSTH
jgi:DNA-binding MarR family transcriptional regulator